MIVREGHTKPVNAITFSPDSLRMASAGQEGRIQVWIPGAARADLGRCPKVARASLAYTADGKRLVWAGNGIHVWVTSRPLKPYTDAIRSVGQGCFSPDGTVFSFQSSHQPLLRWEASSWMVIHGKWGDASTSRNDHQHPTGAIAYSPDGRFLAVSFFARLDDQPYRPIIYLCDAETGEERGRLSLGGTLTCPAAIAFTPCSRFLAAIAGTKLMIWMARDLQPGISKSCMAERSVGRKHFTGLVFTPDGTRLVTTSNDEVVRLWDTTSWNEIGGFEWEIGRLTCVAVSPDGMRMAAGSESGKVVVWDVD